MNQQLTQQQTDKLFAFCERSNVKYYDVQIELVDHMATSIEEQWVQHPDRTFNNAMQIALRDFPRGLNIISREKEQALNKKYNQIHWNYIRGSFSWPKAIRTFALIIILATAFRLIQNDLLVIVPIIVLFLSAIIYYYAYHFPKNIRVKTKTPKKFLLLKRIRQQHIFAFIFAFVPLHLFNLTDFQITNNIWIEIIASVLTVTTLISTYSQMFFIPKKMNQHFISQFSEYAQ